MPGGDPELTRKEAASRAARRHAMLVSVLVLLMLMLLGVAWLRQQGLFASAPTVRYTRRTPVVNTIDLNRAEAWELQLVPGIGPVRARAIIQWRSAHGPFTSFDQLSEVSGLPKPCIERLRERTCIGAGRKGD